MLWKTNFNSTGSSDNLRKVIPYMIFTNDFCSGTYKDDRNMRIVYENDHIFKRWKRGELSNSSCYLTINGDYKYNRKDGCGFVAYTQYVEKRNDEIVFCLKKMGCQSYSISPELYLVCNGKEMRISYVDDYKLGSSIKKECGIRYLVLHFPIDSDDVSSFEIREYKNKKHTDYKTWGTVDLLK